MDPRKNVSVLPLKEKKKNTTSSVGLKRRKLCVQQKVCYADSISGFYCGSKSLEIETWSLSISGAGHSLPSELRDTFWPHADSLIYSPTLRTQPLPSASQWLPAWGRLENSALCALRSWVTRALKATMSKTSPLQKWPFAPNAHICILSRKGQIFTVSALVLFWWWGQTSSLWSYQP